MDHVTKGNEDKFICNLAGALEELLKEAFPSREMNFFLAIYDAKRKEEDLNVRTGYLVSDTPREYLLKMMRGLAKKLECEQAEIN